MSSNAQHVRRFRGTRFPSDRPESECHKMYVEIFVGDPVVDALYARVDAGTQDAVIVVLLHMYVPSRASSFVGVFF